MLRWIIGLCSAMLLAITVGCGGGDDPPKNVVQVANNDSRFSILAEAVQAAGLTDTLTAPGPITVFAPTNDAFSALLGELGVTKDQLLTNKSLLTAVLRYHVVSGQIQSGALPLGKPINPVGVDFSRSTKSAPDSSSQMGATERATSFKRTLPHPMASSMPSTRCFYLPTRQSCKRPLLTLTSAFWWRQ